MKTIKLRDGTDVPVLGQGTWYMGESSRRRTQELEALRYGIDHGLTLIDTAEMYGSGASERLIAEAIRPYRREDLFLVSKVYPHNAGGRNFNRALEGSLTRLDTDYLDMYLYHWRGSIPLEETVACMEKAVRDGKIRRWGVSNLDPADMEELLDIPGAENCQTDQVLYHLGSRGIEKELIPLLDEYNIPVMAYCPLARSGELKQSLFTDKTVKEVAAAHHATVHQILLAFVLAQPNMFTVPKASSVDHVKANIEALDIVLSEAELQALDRAFPAPAHVYGIDMC